MPQPKPCAGEVLPEVFLAVTMWVASTVVCVMALVTCWWSVQCRAAC
jgi:hypothetical protein